MKVFLIQNIANLGKTGETKEVKNSYALNFLLPRGLAVLPNDPRALGLISQSKEKKNQETAKMHEQKKIAQDLNGKKFLIQAKADKNGHLYGSIGPKDLSVETGLSENMFKDHFKKVGNYILDLSIAGETVQIIVEVKGI